MYSPPPAWRETSPSPQPLAMTVWHGSILSRGVDELERPRAFEGARGAQHQVIAARRPDDLQADRQALGGKAARHGGGRLLGQVERIGIGRPVKPVVAVRTVGRRDAACL